MNNFQNMAGPGPGQNNQNQQLFQAMVAHYNSQPKLGNWQSKFDAAQRARIALQLATSLSLMKNELGSNDSMNRAIRLETDSFLKSPTADLYVAQMSNLMKEIHTQRQAQANANKIGAPMGGNFGNMNAMGNMVNMGMGQMPNMGQIPMQQARSQQGQQFPPGFAPQLQHQMQPSPIPMNQQGSMNGMSTPNPMSQPAQQANGQPSQAQRILASSHFAQKLRQSGQPLSEHDLRTIQGVAEDRWREYPNEGKVKMQQEAAQRLPPAQRQMLLTQQVDPGFWLFRENVVRTYYARKVQSGSMLQQGQNNSQGPPANGSQDFDFQHLGQQQANAARMAEAGQLVVPASNNNNGLNASMAGFQGMGPAPPNQNGIGPGNQRMLQHQQQQEQQNGAQNQRLQAQMHQARAHAQAQAQAQAQQAAQNQQQTGLRGQMGGLNNMPPGAQQSPAMPNLNRPFAPPGQPGGGTPQQRPQQQNQAALFQQMQQRMNMAGQNPQAMEAMMLKQRRMQMVQSYPEPLRSNLLNMSDSQFRQYLTSVGNSTNVSQQQGGAPISQGPASNAQNPALNNQLLGGPPMGQQMQQGVNAENVQQMLQQQRMQQQNQNVRAFLQNQAAVQAWDQKPFPPQILANYKGPPIPEQVKLWGQLKAFTKQLGGQGDMNPMKVMMLQAMTYNESMKQSGHAANPATAGMSQQNAMLGGIANQPVGPAPTAPMGANALQPPQPGQQRPGQPPAANLNNITPQELQSARAHFRAKNSPYAVVPDDQLRGILINIRRQSLLNKQQGDLQRSQPPIDQQVQNQSQTPQIPPPQTKAAAAASAAAPQASTKTVQSASATQATANKPKGTPQIPEKQQVTSQQSTQGQAQKGVKRPNEDTQTTTSGAAPNLATYKQAQFEALKNVYSKMTPDDIAKLNPAQRDQYLKFQAVVKKEHQKEHLSKWRAISAQAEQVAKNATAHTVPHQVREAMQTSITANLHSLKQMEAACLHYIQHCTDEGPFRAYMESRARIKVNVNLTTYKLNERLTVTREQLMQDIGQVGALVKQMSNMMKGQGSTSMAQQGAQQPPTMELSRANLEAMRKEQLRLKQQGNNPPAAPIATQPPFQLGAQSSPQGVPQYGQPGVGMMDLQIPVTKRPKTTHADSSTSTPGVTSSPKVGKPRSPVLNRQTRPDLPEPKAMFKCSVAECDHHIKGFETQADLDKHFKDAHMMPDNPMQYAIESINDGLGLNKDGSAKASKLDANVLNRDMADKAGAAAVVKSGQTPNVKQEAHTPGVSAATPMARIATQQGVKSSPSHLSRTPQATKTQDTNRTVPQPSPTKGVEPKEVKLVVDDDIAMANAWADANLTAAAIQGMFEDVYIPGTVPPLTDDIGLIGNDPDLVTWRQPRPSTPISTPESSKGSTSTRASDISETDNLNFDLNFHGDWDPSLGPFGDPDFASLDPQLATDLKELDMDSGFTSDGVPVLTQEQLANATSFEELFGPTITNLPEWDGTPWGSSYD